MRILDLFARKQQKEETLSQAIPYNLDESERYELLKLINWREKHYADLDPIRVVGLMRLLKQVETLRDGDYIEMGTQYGGTAKVIWDLMPRNHKLYCCDTFTGYTQEDLDIELEYRDHWYTTKSIAPQRPKIVEQNITEHRRQDGSLILIPGRIPTSLAPLSDLRWRFVHLDLDLYEPTRQAVAWAWPRMVPGGVMVFHDYDVTPTIRRAADDFLRPLGITPAPMGDRFGSAVAYKPL